MIELSENGSKYEIAEEYRRERYMRWNAGWVWESCRKRKLSSCSTLPRNIKEGGNHEIETIWTLLHVTFHISPNHFSYKVGEYLLLRLSSKKERGKIGTKCDKRPRQSILTKISATLFMDTPLFRNCWNLNGQYIFFLLCSKYRYIISLLRINYEGSVLITNAKWKYLYPCILFKHPVFKL